jgi:formylglycine-generating enzyme required for sulfatase activity
MPGPRHASALITATLLCLGTSPAWAAQPARAVPASTQQALAELQQALHWDGQCQPSYQRIITHSQNAGRALAQWQPQLPAGSDQQQFIAQQWLPKLTQLQEESSAIIARCQAPGYDATGVSMERPDMLREMINEWHGSLALLGRQLSAPPPANPTYARADGATATVSASSTPGQGFRDCAAAFCPQMVVIGAGQFQMGGSADEHTRQNVPQQSRNWELPQHTVQVEKAFAISAHEITVAQFQAFQADTGWQVEGCRNWEVRDGSFAMYYRPDLNPSNPGFDQTADDPVLCVRREDARAFASWLSAKTGQPYRLPYEAEFEYALRGGTQTAFFWGEDPQRDQACTHANVLDPATVQAIPQVGNWTAFACNDHYAYTAPVGRFAANAFGLYDMLGNAREWVDDCWHENYDGAPTTAVRWGQEDGGQCHFPVLRGGAWIYNVPNVRSAYRNAYLSSQARSNMWGFRVARAL